MAGSNVYLIEKSNLLRQRLALVVQEINLQSDKAFLKAYEYLRPRQTEQPVGLLGDLRPILINWGRVLTSIADKVGFKISKELAHVCNNSIQCEEIVNMLDREQMEMVIHLYYAVNQAIRSAQNIMARGCMSSRNPFIDLDNRIYTLDEIMRKLAEGVEGSDTSAHQESIIHEENVSEHDRDWYQLSDLQEEINASAVSGNSNFPEENTTPITQSDESRIPEHSDQEIQQEPVIQHHHSKTALCIAFSVALIIPILTAVAYHYLQNRENVQSAMVPPSHMPEETGDKIPIGRGAENFKMQNVMSQAPIVQKSFLCHFHPGLSAMSSSEAQPIVPYAGHWDFEESAGWTEEWGNLYPPKPGIYRIGLIFKQLRQGWIEILIFRINLNGLRLDQYAVLAGKTLWDKDLATEMKLVRFEIGVGLSIWGWKENHTAIESFIINGKWLGN